MSSTRWRPPCLLNDDLDVDDGDTLYLQDEDHNLSVLNEVGQSFYVETMPQSSNSNSK